MHKGIVLLLAVLFVASVFITNAEASFQMYSSHRNRRARTSVTWTPEKARHCSHPTDRACDIDTSIPIPEIKIPHHHIPVGVEEKHDIFNSYSKQAKEHKITQKPHLHMPANGRDISYSKLKPKPLKPQISKKTQPKHIPVNGGQKRDSHTSKEKLANDPKISKKTPHRHIPVKGRQRRDINNSKLKPKLAKPEKILTKTQPQHIPVQPEIITKSTETARFYLGYMTMIITLAPLTLFILFQLKRKLSIIAAKLKMTYGKGPILLMVSIVSLFRN